MRPPSRRLRQRFCHPAALGCRQLEIRLQHADRFEQGFLQHLQKAVAGDHFKDSPEHVGRVTIVPDRPRLMFERQRCEPVDKRGVGQILVEKPVGYVGLVCRAIATIAVREARRMAHQVLNRRRRPRWHFPPRAVCHAQPCE